MKAFWKKYKTIIISGAVILAVLAFAFLSGSNNDSTDTDETNNAPASFSEISDGAPDKPDLTKEQNAPAKTEKTCNISVSCGDIQNHLEDLDGDKKDIVPPDGVILSETTVSFKDGETAFDVLNSVLKTNRIQLEYSTAPAYGTVYIEGIANIYEFDCGETSGWVYSVNGEMPNYSSSMYKLCDGDSIEFYFSCER